MDARYHYETLDIDLAAAAHIATPMSLENTAVENLAIWISSTAQYTWTVYAIVNGTNVQLGTGSVAAASKPTKVFTEAGPYPHLLWPITVDINNTGATTGHYDLVYTALIRNAYQ